jgi:hypothetical protein
MATGTQKKKTHTGRGDRLSEKRELRRDLCARFGVTTGRQWRRLRREVRRELAARGVKVPTRKGTARPVPRAVPTPPRESDEAVKARTEPRGRRSGLLAAAALLAVSAAERR